MDFWHLREKGQGYHRNVDSSHPWPDCGRGVCIIPFPLSDLFSIISPTPRYCYSHLTDKETETQRFTDLSKATSPEGHEEEATGTEGAASGRADTLSLPASLPGTTQPKTQIEAEP